DDEALASAQAIFDPAYAERQEIGKSAMFQYMTDLMNKVEPPYREGLTRAYAKRFSNEELTELNRFFSTPVGGHYAGESILIYADPQVMASMNQFIPEMMESLPKFMNDMEARMAELPAGRGYGDLSNAEREQLASLLGVTRQVLDDSVPQLLPDEENDVATDAVEE
ncbi:MAG: DUF2059 domain-containing protein, partial [Sphingomonadaceae bacterium]